MIHTPIVLGKEPVLADFFVHVRDKSLDATPPSVKMGPLRKGLGHLLSNVDTIFRVKDRVN